MHQRFYKRIFFRFNTFPLWYWPHSGWRLVNPKESGGYMGPPPLYISISWYKFIKFYTLLESPYFIICLNVKGGLKDPPPAGIGLITIIELKWSLVYNNSFHFPHFLFVRFDFFLNRFFKNHLYSLNPCSLNKNKFTNQRPLQLYQNF